MEYGVGREERPYRSGLWKKHLPRHCHGKSADEGAYTLDYYALAHFSKVIRPKAVRIASTSDESIRSVAFKNTDGSIAVVLFNDSEQEENRTAYTGNGALNLRLAPKSAVSVLIEE